MNLKPNQLPNPPAVVFFDVGKYFDQDTKVLTKIQEKAEREYDSYLTFFKFNHRKMNNWK